MVGLGGFIGSILRYAVSEYFKGKSTSDSLPYGTIAVNLTGCFVIGFLWQLIELRGVFSLETRALMITGVLGGFTTFSAFGNETSELFCNGKYKLAVANIFIQVTFGLAAVWLGRLAAYAIWK
jgi:CrcB protein